MWEPYTRWLGTAIDTVVAGDGKVPVTALPAFRPDQSLPPPTGLQFGARWSVMPLAATSFRAWLARTTQAQLGVNWFADRIWTFDYPGRRLLLHATPTRSLPGARQVPLHFLTDVSTGRRWHQTPYVDVVIAGDTFSMIIETGATVWLSGAALAQLEDGQPSEQATSRIESWYYRRWRERHPEWRVIERADRLTGEPLIEVPRVSIAGFEVGPIWFTRTESEMLPDATMGPAFLGRYAGTIGGSLLRHFVVTLDYQRGVAEFSRPHQ